MLSRPLHIATALFLALVYTVVGLTGSSAHYLVEGLAHAGKERENTERPQRGYYHCHGPDFHWHYHAHEPAAESESRTGEKANVADRQELITGFRARGDHHPHACPLLSLVAALKLTAVLRVEPLPGDGASASLHMPDVFPSDDHFQGLYLARGPPGSPHLPQSV